MNNVSIQLFERNDKKDLYPILTDHVLKQNYPGVYCRNQKEADEIAEKLLLSSNLQAYSVFLDKHMIGLLITEYDVRQEDTIHLAYVIYSKYRGHGFATRAAEMLISKELNPYFSDCFLSMYILPQNKASIKVAKHLGATCKNNEYTLRIGEFGKRK